jgi:CrcB protein
MDYRDRLTTSLLVGFGGFIGANARFWLGAFAQDRLGVRFPWGTFAVNGSGAFVLGMALPLSSALLNEANAASFRAFFAVGVLGAYTTFSTLEFEALALLRQGLYLSAVLYALGSLLMGLVSVWAGFLIGESIGS